MIKSFEDYPDCIYTGFLIRFFAFTIDIIMIGSLQRMTLFYMEKGTLRMLLSLMIYLLYFILMSKLNDGQTIGKMIFGIKVVCLNEEQLTWKTVIVREGFGRYLQKAMLILYALAIFTPYKQHFVDLLTDTSVVTLNLLNPLEDDQTRQIQNQTLND
ncbi:MAG TPA: RDD family protein [Epulopiscium sp.]|nr:RDD family protein [Candidatus Epulonipiscium sp.]